MLFHCSFYDSVWYLDVFLPGLLVTEPPVLVHDEGGEHDSWCRRSGQELMLLLLLLLLLM